jgi:hypothetical protein
MHKLVSCPYITTLVKKNVKNPISIDFFMMKNRYNFLFHSEKIHLYLCITNTSTKFNVSLTKNLLQQLEFDKQ